ncbi:MAG: energy transducer TonB [Bacteroidales bacterium]
MSKPRKKDDYLKMPGYPGGKKAFQDFISRNIRYPEEAMKAGIEGQVIVGYEVTDNGVVQNARIIKGLGYGCDEEALRIVGLLRFEKVKNIKVRVKVGNKAVIHFRLPAIQINYSLLPPAKPPAPEEGPDRDAGGSGYTYTINF